MKLPRVTSDMISKHPDQTSRWLNSLADQLDKIERSVAKSSTSDLPIATTRSLGGVIVGENLSITPSGVLSANQEGGVSTYGELPDKPAINDITLVGNKTLPNLNVNPLTNNEIDTLINNT